MRTFLAASFLVLAGCSIKSDDQQGDTSETATQEPSAASPVAEQSAVRKVSSVELAKAVGSGCGAPGRSEYKGKTGDRVFYALECQSGDFLVSVKLDGSADVLDCAVAETFETPCWRPWKEG